MDTNESINTALYTLQQATLEADEQPAVIRLAPDSDAYVLGNREGYIKLAIAALRAAKGDSQSFKNESWIDTAELDWGLLGFRYDSAAQSYLRPPKKSRGWFRDKLYLFIAAFVAIVFFAVLSAGVTSILTLLKH